MKLLLHKFLNLVLLNDTLIKIITNSLVLIVIVLLTMNATTTGTRHYLSYIFFFIPIFIIVKNVYILTFSLRHNIYFQRPDFFKRPNSTQNSSLFQFLSCLFEDMFFAFFIYLSPLLGSVYLNYRFDLPTGETSITWIIILSMLYLSLTSMSVVFFHRYNSDLLSNSRLRYLMDRKISSILYLTRIYPFVKQGNTPIKDYKVVVNMNQFYQSCIILKDMIIYAEKDQLFYKGKLYGFSAVGEYISNNEKRLDELTSDDFSVIDMLSI